MKITLLVCVLAALVSPAMCDTLLTPHKAQYRVKISVLSGQLDTELQETATGYRATHLVKATGMARLLAGGHIEETSEFEQNADGVRPVRYVSDDTLTRDRTNAAISFDWENGTASGIVNNEAYQSDVEGMVYDRIAIQYELMSDLMNGGASAEYILFDIDEVKTVTVHNIGQRTVKVPAGTFNAIGVQHQSPGSKRVTTMWCVKELDYLPVIVEQHRKGKLQMRAELSVYTPT